MKLTNTQKKLIGMLAQGACEPVVLLQAIYYKIDAFSGEYNCYGRMALGNDLEALKEVIGTSYKDATRCYSPIHWLR